MSRSGVLTPGLLARALGIQYVVGGLLALVVLALPPASKEGTYVVEAVAVLALLLGTASLWLSARPRLPMAAVHGCLVVTPVVVAVAVAATGDQRTVLLLFFLWTTPYFGVFRLRTGALHFAWTTTWLLASMLALQMVRHEEVAAPVLMVLVTAGVASVLVGRLCHELRSQARHDSLTGLPNRDVFADRATAALERWRVRGGNTFVLVVDLDRFKNVNDTYGHLVGDDLLASVTPRLVAAVGEDGLVVRLGGDEFAVLCDDPTGRLVPEDVAAQLDEVWKTPLELDHGTVYVSGSVGAASADSVDSTPASLLRDADAAMYRAKRLGPGRYQAFTPNMRGDDLRMRREQHLREALPKGELRLVYQPVVLLDSGQPVGAEALLRWSSPVLGETSPKDFIGLAEETGVIAEIGAWLLDRAVADLAGWRAAGVVEQGFTVAVNVSSRQLTTAFPGLVAATLARHGVPASALGLEITENALLSLDDGGILDALHDLGVTLLLDDFGTGWSSLAHLSQFPFDVIKIDRSFVAAMGSRPRERSIVGAVLALGAAMDMIVIAEGVEELDEVRHLRHAGCHRAQGFLYSAGVPAGVLGAVLVALRGPHLPTSPRRQIALG